MPSYLIPVYENILSDIKKVEGLKAVNTSRTPPHITVYFFGNADDLSIKKIVSESEKHSFVLKNSSLTVDGVGVFGGLRPRVLFLGVLYPIVLEKYYNKISDSIGKLSSGSGHFQFHPHITLARFKHAVPAADLNGIKTQIEADLALSGPWHFPIHELVLYGIRKGSEKQVHEVIHRFPLG